MACGYAYLDAAARDAAAHGGKREPLDLEIAHHALDRAALLPDEVGGGHAHVLEDLRLSSVLCGRPKSGAYAYRIVSYRIVSRAARSFPRRHGAVSRAAP